MSTQDQARWNERYAKQTHGRRTHPSDLLRQWVQANDASLTAAPIAWDVACGTGRNLLYLAQLGYQAVGLDIAGVGLTQAAQRLEQAGASAQLVEHDLELPSLPEQLAADPALIIVFRYLNLGLLATLAARLAPGGRLVVEVHLQTEAPVGGPSSPRFRAAPGALRAAVLESAMAAGWQPVVEHDYEGPVSDPDGSPMALAQLVVQRKV